MSSRNIWSKVVPMARTSSWRHMPNTVDSSTLRWLQIWRAYSSCGSWANRANSWKESFELGHGGVARRPRIGVGSRCRPANKTCHTSPRSALVICGIKDHIG